MILWTEVLDPPTSNTLLPRLPGSVCFPENTMRSFLPGLLALLAAILIASAAEQKKVPPLDINPRPIRTDKSVKYDFDIIYVRAPRRDPTGKSHWTEVGHPRTMEPGADLVLLHPDGSEEVLVPVKPHESITDPSVSFDGKTVYYAKFHDALNHKGADIYKIHVPTRKITRLTQQVFTPNTGAADWAKTPLPAWGVYNMGPCPLPGGKLAFVSDRNTFKAANPGYAPNALALQLFVMDDDGSNVECIGHLNLGMALHPVILKDGRLMFSSLESQGLRSHHLWGVWSINPDGTHWGPLYSAFEIGNGTADSTHFQAQLSDESIVVESYYNLNNFGFGTYYKFPVQGPGGYPPFGPGYKADPRNGKVRHGRHNDGRPIHIQFPFSPHGIEGLTPFVLKGDWPSQPADPSRKDSPRVGKVTHPSAAPDNHLLTVWSAGSLNSYTRYKPAFDSGIYLIKSGKPVDEPGQMLLIKNDPKYHEQWPRALVPYKRIYGVDEPRRLTPLANDGKKSPQLPEGTPFGLVGTSSLYKRESYPYGVVKPGTVTATFAGEKDPTGYRGHDSSFNWTVQGSDAGLYSNADIHAIRILLLEPTTETRPRNGRTYYNHARERMRILGEFPVRKFGKDGKQPTDPDGNPDTSFLAKVPADVAWTFQTLDRNGMVLNMAQTWHQVRPGEIRNDCGGCHAHSQKPTLFEKTAAAKPDYKVWDLTEKSPLLTTRKNDQSKGRWDAAGQTGLRFEKGPLNVEYFRDVKPILDRSCVACHTKKWEEPAGNLVLDDDQMVSAQNPAGLGFTIKVPGTYARLAADTKGKYGYKPLHRHGWTHLAASRYVRLMQSRRSLLIWKVFGKRLDGWDNDDLPYETTPGDPRSLRHKGKPVPDTQKNRELAHIGYTGSVMPPPKALAGIYLGLNGKPIKVPPLSDEDRLTLVRWIDLGCPIDLDPGYNPRNPQPGTSGWLLDDQRPTLTLTAPMAGANPAIERILVGMHDISSGLDLKSFEVKADFKVDGVAAGQNLASRFTVKSPGVWELRLKQPVANLPKGRLTVSVKDRQGNTTRIERTFSAQAASR
jgi:Hydrazine synthase alpha subunit middle domain